MQSKKAVITILGITGGADNHTKAEYYFEKEKDIVKDYYNTFPLLIEKFSNEYKIVPIFTKEAKETNEKVLIKSDLESLYFEDKYFIENEKDFTTVFDIINRTVEEYDELIIDVSHGFRHLPILMTVDLIIQNFKDSSKIKMILFAKEIEKFKKYEIIDLKDYLELANIAFVLSVFEKNYTVATHIQSIKYKKLIQELNEFSNDLMALNIGNLKKSVLELVGELDKIKDVSIYTQAQNLKSKIIKLTDFNGKKRYLTYFELSKDMFDKNYMLLSLALLYESIRLFIKSYIKSIHKELVEDIEKYFKNDLYKIGDFFKNLKFEYEDNKKIPNFINREKYKLLKTSYEKLNISELYKSIDRYRNNLAHANANDTFKFNSIKQDIKGLLSKFEYQINLKKF